MKISQIRSIELDRSRAFKHRIIFYDDIGYELDSISVTEVAGWEKFNEVYKAWCKHPDFKGGPIET
jgi:hypothetical protein